MDELIVAAQSRERVLRDQGRRLAAQRIAEFVEAVTMLREEASVYHRAYWQDDTGPAVMRGAWLSYVWGKEALRHADLLHGLARLRLKHQLTATLARARASRSMRLPIHAQDVVDAQVVVSKVLREPFVRAALEHRAASLR